MILNIALGIVLGVVLLYVLLAVLGVGLVFLEKLREAIAEFGVRLFRREKKASVTYSTAVPPVTQVVGNEEVLDGPYAQWSNMEPTEKQIALCKRYGINIPSGATRQELSAALDQHFVSRMAR
ncbi:hypothetical protein P8935_12195 [Telmatobacter sp. DSM 110680]|uniref:SAP domain-containing protein n=1 Tax=Telmatobacter sp. DSM 110680 TaxID=3036704 RepID=A0AAU7DQT0_9BACT